MPGPGGRDAPSSRACSGAPRTSPEALRERGALLATWPALAPHLPWQRLGDWPSPLEARTLPDGRALLIKREDLSSAAYGGNKVRPLEVVIGALRQRGLSELWATGAYGSNHALAAAIHAKRQGLRAGVILWPQPWSQTAHDNLVATLAVADEVRLVPSVVHMAATALRLRGGRPAWVMPPGAATPLGAVGHAGAALELAHQLDARGESVDTLCLPVGSTCTTVGLLVGTALAEAIGLMPRAPRIVAVRVTPWPVTDRQRITWMATRAARLLGRAFLAAGLTSPLSDSPVRLARSFAARLELVGDQLGPGYGRPTVEGWRALAAFLHLGVRLDTTYSAKAAAHLLQRPHNERLLFWSTKSAAPLPAPIDLTRAALPRAVARWLGASAG